MPFESPLSERGDLYSDYSDAHHTDHPEGTESYAERKIQVKQVLDIAKDPITGQALPPEAVPASAIKSRIGHNVNVESFAFKPTASELLAQMNQFLDSFTGIIRRYNLDSSHYLLQMRTAFHFAFGSVTQPGTQEDFFHQKRIEVNEQVFKRLILAENKDFTFNRIAAWKQLIHLCQAFLDKTQPSMKLKEIKLNPDGHVVLRMTIQEADSFLDFRNTWQRLFSENYVRYSDPEKITTLACVLGVVDIFGLSESDRIDFVNDLNALFAQFTLSMQNKSYSFDVFEFSESSNRMLQHQDMYGKLTISRGYVRLDEPALDDPTPVDPTYRFYRLYDQCAHLRAGSLFHLMQSEGVKSRQAICDGLHDDVENDKLMKLK